MAKRKTVMASSEEKSAAMTGFFRGTKMEMKKVIWPTKQQMIQYLIAVIVSVVLVSFFDCRCRLRIYGSVQVFDK